MEETRSKIIAEFKGVVSFHTINYILSKLKENTDALGEKVNTYKRLLTIAIELIENCYRYVENRLILKNYQEGYPSYICITRLDDRYKIETGNIILKEDVNFLASKLKHVNSLDEEGLRELYKSTISNGQFSAVGGAGLGFIEIAKACDNQFLFTFEPIDQDVFFYKLMLDVKP